MRVEFERGVKVHGRDLAPPQKEAASFIAGDQADVRDGFGWWLVRSHKAKRVHAPAAPLTTEAAEPAKAPAKPQPKRK